MKLPEYARTLAESMDEFKTAEELLLLGIQYGLRVALGLSKNISPLCWQTAVGGYPCLEFNVELFINTIEEILNGTRDLPEVK